MAAYSPAVPFDYEYGQAASGWAQRGSASSQVRTMSSKGIDGHQPLIQI